MKLQVSDSRRSKPRLPDVASPCTRRSHFGRRFSRWRFRTPIRGSASRRNVRNRRPSRPSRALLVALAAEQPVLFIIEDLHWADPSTRELIDLVFGQVPAAAIFLVMTSRPEFVPPWAGRSHLMHLTVNRVTRNQTDYRGFG